MKIGIDGRLWNETGVGRYIRNLVNELTLCDHENEYVLFVKTGFKKQDIPLGKNWKLVETSIHWHSLEEQLRFPKVLYKENLDMMHFPYFSLPIFYTKPFVVTIHDLILNHFPTGKASTLPYPLYQMKRVGYDFVMQHAIKNSQKIIVPLKAVKDDVMQTFTVAENKIVVTYEGSSHFKPSSISKTDKQKYFLYVGNAYPHKNLERLLSAFTEFRKETGEDTKLVLVGKNDYFYQRLIAKVEQEKIPGVVFHHNIDDEKLMSLYANAIAFISPSLMEGFGLPSLEAMSSSCLVLLSDIPAFKEVCQDVAFYFDPMSNNSLKEKMILVYNLDHKTKEQHITIGLERVKQFSWQKMAKETQRIYESCISLRQS